MYKIYQIQFTNGCIYIGKTKQPMYKRLLTHKTRPCNPNLAYWFNKGLSYQHDLLMTYDTDEEALEFEKKLILKLHSEDHTRLLNLFAGGIRLKPSIKHDVNLKLKEFTPKKYNVFDVDQGKMYRCSKCKKYKSANHYHRDRTRFNGLHSRCKECKNKLSRAGYETNTRPAKRYATICREGYEREVRDKVKLCSICKERKPWTEFYKNKNKRHGLQRECKQCLKPLHKQYRINKKMTCFSPSS